MARRPLRLLSALPTHLLHSRSFFPSFRSSTPVATPLLRLTSPPRAASPSALPCPRARRRASTRRCELRDGVKTDYLGKGVSKAVENVNNISTRPSPACRSPSRRPSTRRWCRSSTAPRTNQVEARRERDPRRCRWRCAKAGRGAGHAALQAHRRPRRQPGRQDGPAGAVLQRDQRRQPRGQQAGDPGVLDHPVGASTFKEAMLIGSRSTTTSRSSRRSTARTRATSATRAASRPTSATTRGLDLLVEAIEKAGYEGKSARSAWTWRRPSSRTRSEVYDLDFKYDLGMRDARRPRSAARR